MLFKVSQAVVDMTLLNLNTTDGRGCKSENLRLPYEHLQVLSDFYAP